MENKASKGFVVKPTKFDLTPRFLNFEGLTP
jgi:hypothetical protein